MLSETPYEIILGVRSSLFLPFRRLGLVIVDEEHETSYKQQEPSPRYHARDTAIMLAHMSGAKTLLGSATPAIESYYNAQTGKYGLVTLNKRFGNIEAPLVSLQNTKDLRRRKKMKNLLAPVLMDEINKALENGEQAILFRNRRGFAPMVECNHVPGHRNEPL
jgi:primosomal protein N' (replication factor Y)